ncbi:MAG: acetate--CoA ligase [Burkholderiales bacterium]|nr:acetate--CoA ligase [Burkholderiales bacterium]
MKIIANIEKSIIDNANLLIPNKEFANLANITDQEYKILCESAHKNYLSFWADLALKYLTWHQKFTKILNQENPPFYKWFEDGKLNISYNCLDRHLNHSPNKIAIIFEADNGQVESYTYKELHTLVCKFANGLKTLEVNLGDRVIIYLPHSVEAIIAMLACARIGAIHSVVFAGFSSGALAGRIIDAQAKIIITADGQYRGGKMLSLKHEVDAALDLVNKEVKHIVPTVIIAKFTNEEISFINGQDIWWDELINNQSEQCPPVWVDSEHPLFILYTSGSTGTPKGIQHSSAGYLLGAITSMQWVFDHKEHDVFWCTADVGWITGHTYVCYGPLAAMATIVIYAGIPTYPAPDRFWRIIERHKVTVFYTAPTAIRTLIKLGAELPNNFNLSSLRLLGTVGEPINPEAWIWYYTMIGSNKCSIVDTWWQTETGCAMLSPMPGITPLKPGSCTLPVPGIMVDIIDEVGNILSIGETGYLVIKLPFPSQVRNIWNNSERYIKAYFPKEIGNGKYYVAGDSAYKDHDGYFWILGRIDDVLNVSGHRLGTMEIESALASHPLVAEAAVVGIPHAIKGEAICAFVVCRSQASHIDNKSLEQELKKWVSNVIGPIAKPDEIRFGENLPKTRSGKIMRRLLRSIARNEKITQDISTLENPGILDQFMIEN